MIGITGSTGHLGRLVIESLLERGVAPSEIVALARSPEKARDLAERGVQVRRADYDEPESLRQAPQGKSPAAHLGNRRRAARRPAPQRRGRRP